MADTPRLNSIIRLLEQGQIPITVFSPPAIESAIELATAKYDGVVFEAEHNPYDIGTLRDCLQYLLNRQQILDRGRREGRDGDLALLVGADDAVQARCVRHRG